jgi:hypothetical protein
MLYPYEKPTKVGIKNAWDCAKQAFDRYIKASENSDNFISKEDVIKAVQFAQSIDALYKRYEREEWTPPEPKLSAGLSEFD